MLSSTSNSNDRLPDGPWRRIWLLTAALSVGLLLGYEAVSRASGLVPSIHDVPQAWGVARAAVGGDAVVFVGSSRIQADLMPGAWEEAWGTQVVQLAILGGSPLPVLEDLAADDSFHGTVIMDALPRIVFDAGMSREQQVEEWIHSSLDFRKSPAQMSELRMEMFVRGHAAAARLSPTKLLRLLAEKGDTHRMSYYTVGPDRFMRLDFSHIDTDERVDKIFEQIQKQGRPQDPEEVTETIRRIGAAVDAIHSRGGRLLLVHFPHEGRIRELENQLYPRSDYWDLMVDELDVPAIHCEDEPSLSGFHTPDGSHLDFRDARAFTLALARLARLRLDGES